MSLPIWLTKALEAAVGAAIAAAGTYARLKLTAKPSMPNLSPVDAPPVAGPFLSEAEEEVAMSLFTKYVEHPVLDVIAKLLAKPSIQSSPAAVADVTDAQAQAAAAIGTIDGAATTVAETITAAEPPLLQDAAKGMQDILDAALVGYLGPIGTMLEPAANEALDLLEQKGGQIWTALIAHVRTLVTPAVDTTATVKGEATAESPAA
jgi:hypothetical protein